VSFLCEFCRVLEHDVFFEVIVATHRATNYGIDFNCFQSLNCAICNNKIPMGSLANILQDFLLTFLVFQTLCGPVVGLV
jgi:ferredoxin